MIYIQKHRKGLSYELQPFKIGLWAKEAEFAYCNLNWEHSVVSNQASCQDLCEAKTSCVGISYYDDHCLTCGDDRLTSTKSGYGFYRRPGQSAFLLL